MQSFPALPTLADAPPALFADGHLWIQEYVDGMPLRFQLRDTGELRFGDDERVFESGEVPLHLAHAVRHVRTHLDRDALRAAVDDVSAVTLFGVATTYRGTEYDWDRTPSVVGVDVWADDRFLPPDAVDGAFARLGLDPVPVVDREVRAAHFDPDGVEVPPSAFRDGPAAGVVFRDKTGHRAARRRPRDAPATAGDVSAAALADRHATAERLSAVVDALESAGRPVTVDAVLERALEWVGRVAPAVADGAVSESALRGAVAEAVRAHLDGRSPG